jgi:hypothetical protein
MLSAGTLINLKQKLFISVIFYNNYGTFHLGAAVAQSV